MDGKHTSISDFCGNLEKNVVVDIAHGVWHGADSELASSNEGTGAN
jgi:hypothetical protein